MLDISGAECTADYSGSTNKLTLTNTGAVMTSISFSQPQSVSGLNYTFDSSGCTISFGELRFEADSPKLSSHALPRVLCSVLRNAASPDALSLESAEKDGEAVFTGEINGLRYTLRTDSATGRLKRITSKAMGLDVTID